MASTSSLIATIAAGVAGVSVIGYCVYFDRKRRNDPLFKQKLRESKFLWVLLQKGLGQQQLGQLGVTSLINGDGIAISIQRASQIASYLVKANILQLVYHFAVCRFYYYMEVNGLFLYTQSCQARSVNQDLVGRNSCLAKRDQYF